MTLAAVLLAGGQSRRMGRDKALLEINGVALWRRQLEVLRAVGPGELLVSAKRRPVWLPEDVQFIADGAEDRGPLGGVAAALGEMGASHLLVLAIDMPGMTSAHLAGLWREAGPGCGVLPWMEPLAAIYPREAREFLPKEDFSMRRFAAGLAEMGLMKKCAIGPQDATLYANCNAPEEWRAYEP